MYPIFFLIGVVLAVYGGPFGNGLMLAGSAVSFTVATILSYREGDSDLWLNILSIGCIIVGMFSWSSWPMFFNTLPYIGVFILLIHWFRLDQRFSFWIKKLISKESEKK